MSLCDTRLAHGAGTGIAQKQQFVILSSTGTAGIILFFFFFFLDVHTKDNLFAANTTNGNFKERMLMHGITAHALFACGIIIGLCCSCEADLAFPTVGFPKFQVVTVNGRRFVVRITTAATTTTTILLLLLLLFG
jgi:hypothetical protein